MTHDMPVPNLAPIDPSPEDIAGSVGFQGGVVSYGSFQGEREYHEDRIIAKVAPAAATGAEAVALLEKIFADTAGSTNVLKEGATASAAIITPDGQLSWRWLGDSPVLLMIRDPATGTVVVEKLIRDHVASDLEEQVRVEMNEGMVIGGRISDGVPDKKGFFHGALALSRAFGDAAYKGVLRESEAGTRNLRAFQAHGLEVYVVVASDGLLERVKANGYGEKINPQELAWALNLAVKHNAVDHLGKILCAFAYDNMSSDNISAVAVKVPTDLKESLFLSVIDGHGGAATADVVQLAFAKGVEPKSTPAPQPKSPSL